MTVSYETLMKQAAMTADHYLAEAIASIDGRLGKGFAKEHPQLIAHFMRTAAVDFATMAAVKLMDDTIEPILSAAIREPVEPMEELS